MKVLAKEIEVIRWFDKSGDITPIKFKYENADGENEVIKVDKVITKTDERLCGNKAIIFDCQSVIDGLERRYQLKFFIEEHRWLLWKF